jgi:hypothetical protein
MAAFFGQMSLDQTGVQACMAPCVTRPLPAKKSPKLGAGAFICSIEQFKGVCQGWKRFKAEAKSRVSGSELCLMAKPWLLGRNAMESKVAEGR